MARSAVFAFATAAAGGLGACATAGLPPGVPPTGPSRDTMAFHGVPGFDTRVYPGDSTLAHWRTSSPYRWVGYYLAAPCHTDSTWVRRRPAIEGAGLGVAVIYTGEQDWGAAATVAGPSSAAAQSGAAGVPAAAAAPRCTRSNLTAARGRADALAADSAMAAEGFPSGSHVYLDVEPVDSVSTPLVSYVAAWIDGLLEQRRYVPAIYAHARNADSLRAVEVRTFQGRGSTVAPRFWVAGGGASFDIHDAPGASAVTYANVWQGASNITETWSGKALRIDVNVADTPSPSAPAPGGGPPGSAGGTRP